MADKNPFVKCKSRKKRKKVVKVKPDVKLYCPSAMVRYDGGTNGFPTMWVCKMCLACCLSDISAAQHSLDCRKHIRESRKMQIPKDESLTSYTCNICDRIFSRQVTLKKHMEVHANVQSDEESDSEKIVVKKAKREKKKAKVVDEKCALQKDQVSDESYYNTPSTSKAAY